MNRLIFHGGEPLLIGVDAFESVSKRAQDVLGTYLHSLCIQTNAMLVDDAWIRVFGTYHVDVGVSMDGPAAMHDVFRVDHKGQGSHAVTLRGFRTLRDTGFDPAVLCVIDPVRSGLAAYKFFLDIGARRIDFLFPDCTHDTIAQRYPLDRPTPVADFLVPVFDAWFEEDDPTIRVEIFAQILALLCGSSRVFDPFGTTPLGHIAVETDGAIHSLDVLRI